MKNESMAFISILYDEQIQKTKMRDRAGGSYHKLLYRLLFHDKTAFTETVKCNAVVSFLLNIFFSATYKIFFKVVRLSKQISRSTISLLFRASTVHQSTYPHIIFAITQDAACSKGTQIAAQGHT